MSGRRSNNERIDTVAPLVIVTGVSGALAASVVGAIEKQTPPWRAVCRPFAEKDGGLYAQDTAIIESMRAAFEFAKHRRSPEGKAVPEPNRAVLAYVDDPSAGRLLDAFGHSVLPMKLADDRWEWPGGRHWRHYPETLLTLIKQALAAADSPEMMSLHLRLQARRNDDALMLPGRNYHAGGDRLAAHYRAWLDNPTNTASDIEAVVETRRFKFEELEEFYKRTQGRNKSFAYDDRGLVFAKSEYGQHGRVWELPSETPDVPILRQKLESLFRFGTPIPEGFQHDVQWTDGKLLANQIFDCAEAGPKAFSGSHANVYPD